MTRLAAPGFEVDLLRSSTALTGSNRLAASFAMGYFPRTMEQNEQPSNNPPPVPPPVPPLAAPPVITPPSSRPPAPRGRGWMVLAIVLLVLLGISLLYNIGNFATGVFHGRAGRYYSANRTAGPRLEEVIREDNDSANKLAVVDVTGIIADGAFEQSGIGDRKSVV